MCKPKLLYFWILNLLPLNPKKSNSFIIPVAEELGLDSALVEKVVGFYWNQVYRNIVSMENTDVQVANFGTFEIKKSALEKKINSYIEFLQNEENLTFNRYHRYKSIEKNLQKMLDLKALIDKRDEEKKNFRKNKNNSKEQDANS
jgi:hypothetical protein